MTAVDFAGGEARIHCAGILAPEQMSRYHSSMARRLDPDLYVVRTSLPIEVVSRLEQRASEALVAQFAPFPLPSGPMLAVATLQVDDLQLRTAVPLVDLVAHAWLDERIARRKASWLLQTPARRRPVLVTATCPFPDVGELRACLAQARTPVPEYLVTDLAQACGWLAQRGAIGSCALGTAVRQVHVAMVWRALSEPHVRIAVAAAVAAQRGARCAWCCMR